MTPSVRSATADDAAAVASIYAPHVEGSAVSFETVAPDTTEMERRIAETKQGYPWLVCEHDGRVVGYAAATAHHERDAYQWSVDVSIYVAESSRRRGVARGLYESLFALLRLQGFYTAYAIVTVPNTPSIAFHESFGFERVGVFRNVGYKEGAWRDVSYLELALRRPDGEPDPPTPARDLRGRPAWREAMAAGESAIEL